MYGLLARAAAAFKEVNRRVFIARAVSVCRREWIRDCGTANPELIISDIGSALIPVGVEVDLTTLNKGRERIQRWRLDYFFGEFNEKQIHQLVFSH